jgi:hypothetical protein
MLGMVTAMVVGTAGVAAAAGLGEQTCRGEVNKYTICLQISASGPDFRVHVGLDVYMSQQDAKLIIEAPESSNGRYLAGLYGADTFVDDLVGRVGVSLATTWERGLSIDFDATMSRGALDEDWDGTDELFAIVSLRVPSRSVDQQFRTNEVSYGF